MNFVENTVTRTPLTEVSRTCGRDAEKFLVTGSTATSLPEPEGLHLTVPTAIIYKKPLIEENTRLTVESTQSSHLAKSIS